MSVSDKIIQWNLNFCKENVALKEKFYVGEFVVETWATP
jgi:hypothetical protein